MSHSSCILNTERFVATQNPAPHSNPLQLGNHVLSTCNYPEHCCTHSLLLYFHAEWLRLGMVLFLTLVSESSPLPAHRSTHTYIHTHVHTNLQYISRLIRVINIIIGVTGGLFAKEMRYVAFIKCLPLRHERPPNC